MKPCVHQEFIHIVAMLRMAQRGTSGGAVGIGKVYIEYGPGWSQSYHFSKRRLTRLINT